MLVNDFEILLNYITFYLYCVQKFVFNVPIQKMRFERVLKNNNISFQSYLFNFIEFLTYSINACKRLIWLYDNKGKKKKKKRIHNDTYLTLLVIVVNVKIVYRNI